jgi:glyoxylate/hydroxypyruvate/2-ketogluconate reductase
MPKLVIAEHLPAFVAQHLQALLPGVEVAAVNANTDDELVRCGADADVLVTLRTRVDARTLTLAPKVRFVQQMGVGYDNLDIAALKATGIVAANNGASTAARSPNTRSCSCWFCCVALSKPTS